LRFDNADVQQNLDSVCRAILRECTDANLQQPHSREGEGQG
jgi:hypothetical protein